MLRHCGVFHRRIDNQAPAMIDTFLPGYTHAHRTEKRLPVCGLLFLSVYVCVCARRLRIGPEGWKFISHPTPHFSLPTHQLFDVCFQQG